MSRFNHHRPISTAMPPALSPSPPPPKLKGGARILAAVLQAVIMAAVLALFFVFAGLAAFILLHLCVLGRALRRGRRNEYREGTHQFPSATPAFPGLSAAELKGMPRFKYSGRSAAVEDCAVCLDELKDGDWCRMLPACGHVFHVQCVDRWLVRTPACPVCRARVGAAMSTDESMDSPQVWRVS